MGVAFVTAHDDKEYIALECASNITAEENKNEVIFTPDDETIAPVRVPSWAFKMYRIDNDEHNVDYFEPDDLKHTADNLVWRATFRYDFDVIHYDYKTMPEISIQTDPISIILKDADRDRSRQIFVTPSLRVFETGWEVV